MIPWTRFWFETEIVLESTATAGGESDPEDSVLEIAFEKAFDLGGGSGREIEGGKTTSAVCEHLNEATKLCIELLSAVK
jgi:hypothetical protein